MLTHGRDVGVKSKYNQTNGRSSFSASPPARSSFDLPVSSAGMLRDFMGCAFLFQGGDSREAVAAHTVYKKLMPRTPDFSSHTLCYRCEQ